jgi:arylsulfatase A-like enzyme/Flp pilus assembly protein TadD
VRFLALALLAAGCSTKDAAGPVAPAVVTGHSAAGADVLLITIDTLRADAVGFLGNELGTTANLDRIAAQGRVFANAHAHSVVTLPSHTNILSGRLPYEHGVRDNAGYTVPADLPTLATMLQTAGYATAAFVGAYPLDSHYGLDRGFDVYDDSYPRGSHPGSFELAERRGDRVIAPALAWWTAQQRPRFLWVHLYDPHAGYEPSEPFRARFSESPYLGEVAAVDTYLAPLLAAAEKRTAQRPLLAVMTADHGEALGDHGELTHGLFAYEPTLRVPLLLWGSGISPARDEREAWHIDIVPTILAYLGMPPPPGLRGNSLLSAPLGAGATTAAPGGSGYFEAVSTHLNRGWAPLRGYLHGGHKWIDLPLPEFYDLATDPAEQENLWPADRRGAAAVRAGLASEPPWPPASRTAAISSEEANRLKSLGYVVGEASAKKSYGAADDPKTLLPIDRLLHESIDAYSRGQFPRAADLARQVIAARPEIAEGYTNAALALRQLERHAEAIAILESGLGKVVARETHLRQLAMALAEVGQSSRAAELLQSLRATGESATLNVLGIALSDSGNHGEGLAVLEEARSRDSGDPTTLENLGIVRLRMGQALEARAALEQALRLNDALPISWNTLGVVRYQLEGPAAAIAAWQRAVALDARQFDALFNLGLVAAQNGQAEVARGALRQFVSTAPPARFADDLRKARGLLQELGG